MGWQPIPLMRTPAVIPLESPVGYLLRLANANGFRGIGRLLPLLGVDREYVITMGWNFDPLRPLLGAQSLPDGFGYKRGANARGAINLQGHASASEHVGFRTARVCPDCLTESAHIRGEWDLKAYVACHRHGRMMLKCCDACGQRISAFRCSLTHCNCGKDLRAAEFKPAPDVLLALMEVLHAKVTGSQGDLKAAIECRLPFMALLAMDLDVLCKVLVQLTAVLHQIDTGHRPHRKLLKVSELLPRAATVLSCWPDNFHSLCADWRAFCTRTKKKGLLKFQSCFDWLFVRLHKNLRKQSSQTLFMLQAALVFAMETWDLSPVQLREAQLRSLKLPSPRFASKNYAAGAIGIRQSVLSSRAAAGKIPGRRIRAKGRTLFVVDMEAIRSIRFSRFEDVAMPRALRMLGVSVAIYRPLRKDGDIPSDHVPTRPGGLAREDLLAFRSSVMSLARKAPACVRLYSFGAFLEGPTPASVKIDYLRRIRRGDIAVYHRRSKSTFKDLFTKRDLVLESRDTRIPTFGSDQMGMCDLVAGYRLNDYEANAVVGHLTHDSKAKFRKTASGMDVDAFMRKYRPLRCVAKEFGVAVPTMHAIARHNECRECMLVLRHGLSKSRRSDLAYFVDRRFEGRARKILRRLGLPRRAGGANPATNLPRSRNESRTRPNRA